jgi:hypothetical protein
MEKERLERFMSSERIDKSKIPIKYSPETIDLIKCTTRLCPKTQQTDINKLILMLQWFENTMDDLERTTDVFNDIGWRKIYKIQEPIVKLEDEE